jgi:hypothetical protein
MPFDLTGRQNIRLNLLDAATALGIVGIPSDELCAYKEEQVRQHPGSVLYHHRQFMADALFWIFMSGVAVFCAGVGIAIVNTMFFLCGVSTTTLSGWYLGGTQATILIVGGGVTVFCAIWAAISGKTTEPAHWVESDSQTAPTDILRMARRLQDFVPGSEIVTGHLVQNKVILDPYMVVRYYERSDTTDPIWMMMEELREPQEVVIGIWDDNGIIRLATTI